MTEQSDPELLAAHVAGDPDAFSELFRRHQNKLWAVALRTLRDPDDASDALQEAMVSAFRRAETFQGNAKVGTWLYRIVVNACLDRIRSKKARPTVSLPEQSDEFLTYDGRDPIAEHETKITVDAALSQLPPEQRTAVVLVDLEGWSVQEAAELLNCPAGTVKSRCSRGRTRLAQILGNPPEQRDVQETESLSRRKGEV